MKFGIHAGLWLEEWRDDPSFVFEKVAKIGFDGVELSLLDMELSQAKIIGKKARAMGLSLTCSMGLGVGDDPSSSDITERQNATKTLKKSIDIVSALGAKSLAGVVASPWGVFYPKRIDQRMKYAAETLGGLQDHLAKNNVRLGIESINRFEGDLTVNARQTLWIAEHSDADNVGVLLDAFHMNIEEKNPSLMLEKVGEKLFHYHISGHDRGVPKIGRYDFEADSKALKKIGYDNWVVAEMFVRHGVQTGRDLNIWYPIELDVDIAAKQALKFMKEVYL